MARRYQRGNQKPQIEGETIQWPEDTKGIVLSLLLFTASDYPFGIFWPLYCLSFDLRLLITPLVSSGHCIVRQYNGQKIPKG
jgi:hypothetical protein